jgi:hypothetical protein
MKISVNDQELFKLSETQKKVIKNDIHEDIFEDDMKRRLKWVLFDEKYKKCFERLKKEWEPKLKERGIEMFPSNDEAFAELIFSQPDYKNRSQRESLAP